MHPETWAEDLIEGRTGGEQDQAIFLIGMYSFWMQRNNRRRREQAMPIRVAVQWAVDLALDLGQLMESPREPATARSEPCWERPPLEWFKCNADGAFYDQQWKGATGVVLRDDSGVFVKGDCQMV